MKTQANFSKDRTYRYRLSRTWDESKPSVLFIGLNPSTADEKTNDPTIRRLIGFARRWGFGSMYVCNLFAFRTVHFKVRFKIVDILEHLDHVGTIKYVSAVWA